MGRQIIADLVMIATAIVSLAIIAVIVSKQANTSSVIGAAGSALASDIKAAVSPLSMASSLPSSNLSIQ